MATTETIHVNARRLWQSLMDMAATGPGTAGGCNRQALTDADKAGRDLFLSWAKALGCSIAIDGIGNIFARREGHDPALPPVLTGSHLDTQPTGGRFDGVYGVLAGLEVLRTLEDHHHITTRHPLEVAVWTNEEGCRFTPAMLGSGVVAGVHTLEFALNRRDRDGKSLGDELERIGYNGSLPVAQRPWRAMLEAHIEQGPILDREKTTIGVVTGIQGAYWFDIILEGAACHAGPTPMNMRQDPARAAHEVMAAIYALAERHGPWARVTFGNMTAQPGVYNTVPEQVSLALDLRHPEESVLGAMVAETKKAVHHIAAANRVRGEVRQHWYMPPVRFDDAIVDIIERAARKLGYSHRRIVSGAGHDSLNTVRLAPTAMIFVPCKDGISHNENESATPEDLAAGADVLLNTILEIAGT